jgi:hypothetical protein
VIYHPIFWQGRESAVNAYGNERRDGLYAIEPSMLCRDHDGGAVTGEGTREASIECRRFGPP